jgi:PAS domain S-box-containing protein
MRMKLVTLDPVSLATDYWHLPCDIAKLNFHFDTVIMACLVATLAYLSARLGGVMVINAPQTLWPLWPGCALLVAVLLVLPRRIWSILLPAGLAGFVVYDLQVGASIRSIAWLMLADTLEILVAAWGVSYSLNGLPRLNSLKALAKYSFFTVILASLVVSSIGTQGLNGDRWLSWRIGFLSEALAFLTVTPAILGWFGQGRGWVRASRGYYLEAAVLVAAVISLSYFVFVARGTRTPPTLLYSLVPFLLWSALRFGSTGASSSATIVALLAIWGVVHGRGPFTESDPINNVLSLQVFLLFTAAPFMVLAAVVEEHEQDERELREGEERFRLAADTAPVLIWMSSTDKLCNFFNQGWLDFTGRSMEDEVGSGWALGVHPDDLEVCLETYSASFDARVDFEMEYRLRRFDGEYRWVIHHGVPRFESDGTFCGYIGSCADITERKSASESLQALTGRLIHAQEEERARIARELHDDFSQGLALQCIDLEQLLKKLPESEMQGRAMLLKLLKGTKAMSKDLRSLSHQLHSSKLEFVGLVPALSGFCQEIAEKYKIEVHFTECGTPLNIPKDVALCLLRITQEALGNVIKHSQAKRAQVELGANEYGLSLRIADEGRGFDPDGVHPGAGLGLVGMTERLRLVRGRLLIRSELMQGTEIFAEVPLSVSPSAGPARALAAGRTGS